MKCLNLLEITLELLIGYIWLLIHSRLLGESFLLSFFLTIKNKSQTDSSLQGAELKILKKTTSLIGNSSYSNQYVHMYTLYFAIHFPDKMYSFFSFNMTAYIFMLSVIKLILFSLIMIFQFLCFLVKLRILWCAFFLSVHSASTDIWVPSLILTCPLKLRLSLTQNFLSYHYLRTDSWKHILIIDEQLLYKN